VRYYLLHFLHAAPHMGMHVWRPSVVAELGSSHGPRANRGDYFPRCSQGGTWACTSWRLLASG
jgi:hypothetical protein